MLGTRRRSPRADSRTTRKVTTRKPSTIWMTTKKTTISISTKMTSMSMTTTTTISKKRTTKISTTKTTISSARARRRSSRAVPGWPSMEGSGSHLMLDGYGCEQKKLEDLEHIYRILEEYPGTIGMTKIMPPYVFRYTGVRPENWGVSGFVLIAESHISVHTFPEKQ